MSDGTGKFPLEPLCTVRGMRLRKLEAELKACRAHWSAAEQQRAEAAERCAQTVQQRQDFAARSWRELFEQGAPTAEAMRRHEHHLALLDQLIAQCQAELAQRTRERDDAAAALDLAATAWQRAHHKLDALGELKQEWLRQTRSRQALHEEHGLEELMLRQTRSR
ncbi:hypothetical protein [Dyella acidiphila]|uniref:Type III secretion protein n=1 Tax=Dyella acidiphila TaxID=2775866 RepID=A0ABR9GBL5_9GAMM|nr:hypothetical protein [Dyella acidiphila]MBE1161430.1 hypothetical protein [Dyella acidiphila]